MGTRQSGNAPRGLAVLAALLLGACAPPARGPAPAPAGLPPIPRVEGPLQIRVVHPTPSTPKPRADSTYIYGSVGSGAAELSINGTPVEVRPNGAFLAYLPVPPDGTYQLTARAGGRSASATAAYRAPAEPPAPTAPGASPAPAPATEEFSTPRGGVVTGGADTLATGSGVAVGRPTPGGTYRWFLPRGARVEVTGRRGDLLRVRLDTATAWLPASQVTLAQTAPDRPAAPATAALGAAGERWAELRVRAAGAPFLARVEGDGLHLTLYGRAAPAEQPAVAGPGVAGVQWRGEGDAAVATIRMTEPVWGYKAWYAPDGDLVLRVRRPPRVDPAAPLRGVRVAVDPGHPPGGATGPTGLTEGEANLAIALRLADLLRARGAEVLLTRSANVAVPLPRRVEMAVAGDADLLVSVHNNAFAEGVNPFRNHGTSTYYFHPFSAELARSLNGRIAATTRIPDLGARWGNLALVRPTWLPSALTESLYMLIPEQEAALRDPRFLDRLAAAHAEGIEEFLRSSVAGLPSSVTGPSAVRPSFSRRTIDDR